MNFLVKKFYKTIRETTPGFERKILDAKRKYNYLKDPKEKLCTIIEKVILPCAEKLGYNFDIYDLLIFEEEASVDGAKLLENQVLEKVSGGQRETDTQEILGIADYFDVPSSELKNLADYWYEKNKESIG